MKNSMYNVIWYDGIDAYVTKWVLSTDIRKAIKELQEYWQKKGYDGEVLKLDVLYEVSLENIIALKDNSAEDNETLRHFEEMYF